MPHLEQIYFIITRKCNLFCAHCIRSSGPSICDSLSLEAFRSAITKLHPFASNAQLLISGGEPTLHAHFHNMVHEACLLYPKVIINTNGLRKAHLIKAHEISNGKLTVQISIDGDEQLHDAIRGKDSFRRSMNTVQELAKHNINVIIATTVGSANLPSIPQLDKTLQDLSFSDWTIQREVIYGRASLSKNQLDTSTWNNFAKSSTTDFLNKHRLKIATMFDWGNMHNTLKKNKVNKVLNCGTGSKKLYINPDLTAFPCGCMEELIVGDLKKDSGKTVMMNLKKTFTDTMIRNPICKACPFTSICNGGCPGASKNYFGTFGQGDPRCAAIQDLAIKTKDAHA